MSADFNTTITLRGNSEEFFAMLKVLKEFENADREQYIDNVCVKSEYDKCYTEDMDNEDLRKFLSDAGKELTVEAMGPWGHFDNPKEIRLFEALAEASPNASFKGNISGENCEYFEICGELKNGKLSLSDSKAMGSGDAYMSYTECMQENVSHENFCELFKIDENMFDEDLYCDFISEIATAQYDFPNNMCYDVFMELCEYSEIDEEQYEEAKKELSAQGFESFDDFVNSTKCLKTGVYDPIVKTYTGNYDNFGSSDC